MSYGDKKSVLESVTPKDQILVRKFGSKQEYWRPLSFFDGFIEQYDLENPVVIPPSVNATVEIDYDSTDVNAVWIFGNYTGKITCANPSLTHSGIAKWHFSRLDTNAVNLDTAYNGNSLFDKIVDATDGTTVIVKIYNRQDPAQYIYLHTETAISKQNPTPSGTIYYDLELDAQVIGHSGIEANSVQNPSVTFLIGRSVDVVRNNTDDYASIATVKNVVSLTDAEYSAIVTKDSNTLYITDANSCVTPTIGILSGGEYNELVISGQLLFELSEALASYTLPLLSGITDKTFFVTFKNTSNSVCTLAPTSTDLIEDEVIQLLESGDSVTFYLTETQYRTA